MLIQRIEQRVMLNNKVKMNMEIIQTKVKQHNVKLCDLYLLFYIYLLTIHNLKLIIIIILHLYYLITYSSVYLLSILFLIIIYLFNHLNIIISD